ncbi:MAG: SpoIIE family protein phosphatase, partial [Acidobacteria bacterium]|nr:SpoIIE family protein phosphatase [Acidobacteriota bacterium]NIQ83708.1 SpoIIE family protein phosphatase [Acidobacteriota bacterium]
MGADGSASYTSAGHPAVLVRERQGEFRELRSNSRPIGLLSDQRYAVDETRLKPGDT